MNFPEFSPAELSRRELFDSAVVALSMSREDGSYVAVNAAFARLFGYESPEALMADADSAYRFYVDPEDRRRWMDAIRDEAKLTDLEVQFRRRDGTPFWASVGVSAIKDADGQLIAYHAALYDVTEARAARAMQRLEQQVTLRFAQARNVGAALEAAIRAICETERWEAGRYLRVDAARNVLCHGEAWCVPDGRIQRYIDESRRREYAPGVGLVGHVWQTGEPLWVPDIGRDPRVARPHLAEETGMRGSVVLPVHAEGRTIGVFIFDSREIRQPDHRLLRTLSVIAGQVGLLVRRAQAEEAMRESEARFRSLTALSADWYWEQDAQFTLTFMSNQMERKTGLTSHAYIGQKRWNRPALNLSEADWAAHREQLERHEPFHDFELQRPDGKGGSVWVSLTGEPVLDAQGRFAGYRGVGKDITERVAKEAALGRLTRMYAALSSLNEAIPRIGNARELLQEACEITASSGNFVRAAVRLLDRASGRTRFVASSGTGVEGLAAMEISIAAQAAQGPSLVVEAIRSGKPVITRDYQNDPRTEVARRTAAVSGARSAGAFPLWHGGQCSGVLILHGSEPWSFDGDMQPLLERMAQNLSFGLDHLESESRFRQSFELAATGMAHIGTDRRFIRVNRRLCEMLGYAAEELVGLTGRDISHRDDRDIVNDQRPQLYAGEIDDVRVEKRYLRKDGATVWVALTVALARDAHGAPAYEICIIEDVTARKRDERLLALEHAVTRRLAAARDEAEGIVGVIREVCQANDWPVGRYFAPDPQAKVLRFREAWGAATPDVDEYIAASRSLTYAPGKGLSGWVWRTGEPLWVADVSKDPRAQAISWRTGGWLRGGAMVLPVSAGEEFLGALSFSRPEPSAPDERLLRSMHIIASQLGQFLQRNRGDAERALLQQRDEALVRALGEIIYDWRPLADRLIWEGDFTRILGYEDMGNDTASWTSRVHPDDAPAVLEEVAAATRDRRNYDLQYRFRHRDGRYLWMHDRGVCSFGAQGELTRIIGVLADIDARKKAEQALRGIVQASAEPLLLVRQDGTVQFVNPAAEALFGREAGEMEGALLGLPLADGRPAEVEIVLPDGGVRPAEMQFAATELEGQELLVVSLHDLSERKRYEQHIEHLANHDGLTSLPNRTLLRDRVEQAIAHARRSGGHVGLMFVDLDQFKLVNDSWGHAVGDRLLLEVALRLQKTVRDGDTVARLGGDEFVVLLPNLARADNTSVVAGKIAEALERPLDLDGRELRLTASMGIALFPDDGEDLDALLQCADAAMYRAKDAGRNGYQYYSADMGTQARARVETEAGLRLAMERGELRLHYQPQLELERGEIKGFEALMRWEHPSRGMVSPMDFIPVAEESGLIMPMGEWALLTACREAMAWSAAGHGPLKVAVNLSPRQFWRGSVTEAVRKAIGESGLAPSQLEIEITESVVARDLQNVMLQLEQLRRLGTSIAIDDFGTGYSSLAYLRSLPINKLKIDKSFIRGIPADREATALVGEIIRLAHVLSLEVVAEGVETQAQADFLRQSGCEAMQGYLFARPMPGPECAALLRSGRRLSLDAR